ncbi:MAG: DUF5110 domain-containing protein [Bacteroidales bacterium]|nr:DUF5110 domain-containing protein [Bacteroidales bacterium]
MKKAILALLTTVALCGACTRSITFPGADEGAVRITAITDDIIHVEAVPAGASFSRTPSLAVIRNHRPYVRFRHREEADAFVLETGALRLRVAKSDGSVSYYRLEDDSLIAAEEARSFSPVTVEGRQAWTVRQTFLPQDEGFYGLGQHQADEWDYKGRNEELYQYNTKISVPFVVSSRRYGILWDSYSLCRWGDPRPYASLGEVFTLRDKDGVEGALTGTYVPARGETLVRRETALEQEFLHVPDCDYVLNAPRGFRFSGSHVTFEGTLEPRESGLFHFYLYYAGYTQVFLDGEAVTPEIWRTAWNPNGRKFEVELQEGRSVPIRIEWRPDGGTSYCALRVLSPVPEAQQARMSWWGEMQDQLDYYFVGGETLDEVIGGYRTLTGKAPVMPKWAMGYWQSRERYTNQDELVATFEEFRERGIPIDNIVQDWQYWPADQWGSHAFEASRYPDPKGMVDRIHELDGRFMISVWPKFYTNTEHFRELDEQGWIYPASVRDSVEDWLGHQQGFYDAYAPGARKLFWQQMQDHLYPTGVDAWWMDASEPNIHDCTDMDYRKELCGPTALGPSAQYFNAYALVNAQAIYEGQRGTHDNRRVFLLTRNGFAGLQRYSTASWSGDIGTRWEDMKAQISAGLNYSISGIPFWGQDIGGFSVENRFAAAQRLYDRTGEVSPDLEEWREMQARWHQWGVFCPLYRAHGQWPYREPWNIAPEDDPAYRSILDSDETRYILMPYIYTMAARVHFDDYTIMRPLVMDFTDDARARATSDEYLFGDALLVCPVYTYRARSREVYLPQGSDWYDAYDNYRCIRGGTQLDAPAPYGHIPLYWRSGQIVVSGSCIQSTAEVQTDLTIRIFSGADADYRLYDDNGTDYDYEKGAYSWIPMHWDEAARALHFDASEGSWPGMPEKYTFTVLLVTPDGTSLPQIVSYDGRAQSLYF